MSDSDFSAASLGPFGSDFGRATKSYSTTIPMASTIWASWRCIENPPTFVLFCNFFSTSYLKSSKVHRVIKGFELCMASIRDDCIENMLFASEEFCSFLSFAGEGFCSFLSFASEGFCSFFSFTSWDFCSFSSFLSGDFCSFLSFGSEKFCSFLSFASGGFCSFLSSANE